ncbi:DUF2306 domain-containing protein [Pseudochryseolinea flava]|uniref:DUF2306 domain-containing protein n=1 Tax=Pseudochryseolinea flava TaxID=2059302 RepID=A0A364Y2W7_9BACT|nr:DUF2306 domain-containing protein [Pseudochryseolinea flava]RAW01120.1 DUF2306 domain-containing protein [Pseudochryseolinea flava]
MVRRNTLKVTKFLALVTLLFFSFLMLRITLPYLSLERDVRFLQIKRAVIDNDGWRTAFFVHVFSSIFLLIAGFTQFFSPLKKRYSAVHKLVGKMYVVILLFISGPAGLIMAFYANGGWTSQLAFVTLSFFWLWTTAKAWLAIRDRDFVSHGEWMIRSFALTLSALTLRAWKFVLVMILHPPPMTLYMIVAWLGWIPNLLLAEWLIRKQYAPRILRG